jgi:phage-related protein
MGYSDFGLRIGVEGEKDFKAALSNINQTFKVLGSEMKLVSSEFDKNDKSVGALTARNEVLNKSIDAQKDKVSTLESALKNAADSFGESDKRTQSWQIQLNNAKAALNGMERELSDNVKSLDEMSDGEKDAAKQADNLGDEAAGTAKEADKLGDELGKTADSAENSGGKFEKLGGILKGVGTACAAAFAAIGAAAVSAGKGLYDIAAEAAAAGDRIDKTSQKLGLSASGFQEWEFVLSHNGASIESLSAGLNKLNNTVDDAANGNDKAAEKFARLGISMDDLKGKSREDIFNMTVAGLQGISDESEKAAIAADLLGKSAVELGPLLNQSAEATAELKRQANDLGIVMSDDAVASAAVFTDSMDNLNRSFGGFKNRIGAEMLPGLTLITDGLTGIIAGTDGAAEQIQQGAAQVVQSVTGVLPQIMDVVMSLIGALAEVAPQIISALVSGIVDNLPTLIPAAVDAVVTIVQGLIQNLPMLLDAALQLVIGLADGILAAIPQLIAALPALIQALVDFVIGAIPQIIDAGIKLLTSLVSALPEIITAIVEAIPQIIDGLVTAVLESIPQLIDAGIALLVSLIQSLPTIITTLVTAIPQIIASLISAIIGSIPQLIQAGIQQRGGFGQRSGKRRGRTCGFGRFARDGSANDRPFRGRHPQGFAGALQPDADRFESAGQACRALKRGVLWDLRLAG